MFYLLLCCFRLKYRLIVTRIETSQRMKKKEEGTEERNEEFEKTRSLR